ncbi:TonB-dependent siderophore receptor [Halopseudomonas pelagia]|uniref:TonB-dependent siderophore receptor n=1 Tax=Halopseudomonas pelagia TaxID=553151 RepID=UPI0003A44731|nr:TonB-dependent siderophore receptor [Halopseudomonas pelagia]
MWQRKKLALTVSLAIVSMTAAAVQADEATEEQRQHDVKALAPMTITGASHRADDGVTEGTGAYTSSSMSSATGLRLAPKETPQSVAVITRQQMDDFALGDVSAALSHTTGISVNKAETDRVFPTARGFDITHVQIDGTPIEAQFSVEGDFLADTAIYDRVEIVRGAAGLLSGAGNPSAAINLVRKRPTRAFQGTTALSTGSWDKYRAETDVSGPLTENGRLRGRLVAAYQDNKSYIDFLDQQRKVLYGVGELDLTDNTTLSVGLDYQHQISDGSTYGEPVPLFFSNGQRTDFSRSTTTGTDWTVWDKERSIYFADLVHQFDNGWTAKLSASHLEGDYFGRMQYLSGYMDEDTGTGFNTFLNSFSIDRSQTGVNLFASGPFEMLGREHELIVGWNRARETNDRKWYDPLTNPDPGSFYDWNYPRPVFNEQASRFRKAVTDQSGYYSATRLSITDALSVIAGVRVSNWEREEWVNKQKTDEYRHTDEITPYGGLILDINETYSLYAGYSQIFNPQSNRDVSNQVLAPVEGTSYDVGIKASFLDDRLNASLSVFRIEQDNVAEPDRVVDGEQRYRAREGVVSEGFEAEVSGEVAPGARLYAGYTHRKAEDTQGQAAMTYEPEDMFRLSGTYDLTGGPHNIVVGGAARWQGDIYKENSGPNGETARQGSYVVLDLMARQQLMPALTASVNINNLLDRTYYTTFIYNGGFYGAPRNAELKLQYAF